MKRITPLPFLFAAVLAWGVLAAAGPCRAQATGPCDVCADRPGGIYKVGDTVHWTVQWKGGGAPPDAQYVLKSGGWTEVGHGQVKFSDGKFPAILIPQWAGVYGLDKNWVTDFAAKGWLALDIEAHDIPIDRPKEYYKELFDGPLKGYWEIGNDDREGSYFLRMYLSCTQALDYLRTRPDWNGKVLVVAGASQGGMQALMVAGLHPDEVTAVMALVPAGCDMLAPEVGRAPGWPA